MIRRLICCLALLPAAPAAWTQTNMPPLKFDFTGKAATGYAQVLPTTSYDKDLGYGFDLGSKVSSIDRGVTGDQAFFFSVALPEGNYNVTVTLGDRSGESSTAVRAESRRLMLQEVHTQRGEFATRMFKIGRAHV